MDTEGKSRRSIRLKDFDYSQPGGYFLTFVTFQREHLFGEIVNGEMRSNNAARIVQDVWEKLTGHFTNVVLDEMIIMPNHFHGIVFITDDAPVGAIHELPLPGDELPLPGDELPLPEDELPLPEDELPLPRAERSQHRYETPEEYRIRRRRMVLPKLVGYFKMNSAKAINLILNSSGVPVWQRNYYEHIIRNDAELDRIRKYISYNPQHWGLDDENR